MFSCMSNVLAPIGNFKNSSIVCPCKKSHNYEKEWLVALWVLNKKVSTNLKKNLLLQDSIMFRYSWLKLLYSVWQTWMSLSFHGAEAVFACLRPRPSLARLGQVSTYSVGNWLLCGIIRELVDLVEWSLTWVGPRQNGSYNLQLNKIYNLTI